jgi:hypothetical protein
VTAAPVRTVERGYASSTGRRAGQVSRVHVIRDIPPRTERGLAAGHQTWCGQTTGRHQNSAAIVRDAPHVLPDGLAWCPHCIGRAAEYLGLLEVVARVIGISRDGLAEERAG